MRQILSTLTALLFFAAPILAAEINASGKFSFTALSVKGLVIRDRIVVDEAFGKKHKVKVAAPFEFAAPRMKGLLRFAKFPAVLGDSYIKLVYGTSEKEFLESIQFNHFALDLAPLDTRQKQVAGFLKAKVWPGITGKQGDKKIDIIRGVKVGERDAVELIGRYVDIQDKSNGVVLTRVVALLQKEKREGLLAIINIATARVAAQSDEQLRETLSEDILNSIKFK